MLTIGNHVVLLTDPNNNLGRRCDVIGVRKDTPRGWTVLSALARCATVPMTPTHYLLRHLDGSELVVPSDQMTSLY